MINAGAAAAHVLDDRRRVVNEELVVIDRLLDFVEDERRGGNGVVEPRRVDGDAFLGAEARVALALKGRPRKDQREIDVEKDGTDRQGRSLEWLMAAAPPDSEALRMIASPALGPAHGPATTICAVAGSMQPACDRVGVLARDAAEEAGQPHVVVGPSR